MTQVDGRDGFGQTVPPPPPAGPAGPMVQLPDGTWVPAPGIPAPAPTAPPQLPFGLTSDDLGGAFQVLLRSFAPVLAGLTVLVAVFAAIVADQGHGGSLADWIRTAVLVIALAMGGRATLTGAFSGPEAAAELEIGVRFLPLAVTLILLVLVARSSRRQERAQPSTTVKHLLARAALTGLAAGLVVALLAALSRTSGAYGLDLADEMDAFGAGVDVGAGPLGAAVGTVLLVGIVSLFARVSATPAGFLSVPAALGSLHTPERAWELSGVLRVLRTFLIGLLAVTVLGILVFFLHQAVLTDELDGDRLQAFSSLLVLGANVVVVVLLAGLGVPLTADGQSAGSYEVLEFLGDDALVAGTRSIGLSDKPVLFLVLLVPVLVALFTAVRRTLRDHTPPARPGQLKQAAVLGAVVGLLAAFLVQVSASGSISGAVEMLGAMGGFADVSAGPSLLWAPLLGAVWAVVAMWTVRFGPTLVLSLPARLVRLAGGRAISPAWDAALAGAGPAPAGRPSPGVRLGALLLLVATALAALAAAVVAVLNAVVFTPAAAAEDYIDAVADTDMAALFQLLPDAPDPADHPLLTSDVLDSGDFVAISDVAIGRVDESDAFATVQVSYSIDGERHEDSIDLRTGEDHLGFFRSWELAETLPAVEVWSEDVEHRIAGVAVPNGSHVALPGRYMAHAGDDVLLTAAPDEFTVTTDAAESPQLAVEVKPEAMDAARAAVQDRIDECAASTEVSLENCPFYTDYYWMADLSDVSFEITREAGWSLEYDQFVGGFRISSGAPGEVVIRGTETVESFFGEPAEERPYEDTEPFSVYGEVTVSGGEFQVEFPY